MEDLLRSLYKVNNQELTKIRGKRVKRYGYEYAIRKELAFYEYLQKEKIWEDKKVEEENE